MHYLCLVYGHDASETTNKVPADTIKDHFIEEDRKFFDEGKVLTKPSNLQEDCLQTRGPTCRVATIVATPHIKARKDRTFYTTYSLLKTNQELLGLTPLLGHAADPSTASMRRGLGF